MDNIEQNTGRLILLWMFVTITCLSAIHDKDQIFRIGPNNDLLILHVHIDTYTKYSVLVSFCFLNSIARALNHNIIQSWITNTIQDKQNNQHIKYSKAYEVTVISTIYIWFDFFMYMNILLSQIDMLLVEILADLLISCTLTRYYLYKKAQHNTEYVSLEHSST
jgi:hypothetical protein